MITSYKRPIGKTPRFLIVISLVILFNGLFLSPGSSSANSTITIVDTLGAATPSTKFSVFGAGGQVISNDRFFGPEFTLTQSTEITEIGAFLNCELIISAEPQCPPNAQPVTVQIRPASNGNPDLSTILATFVLTDDQDPSHYSYESVNPGIRLEPGTYFAIFATQGDDVAVMLSSATDPFDYQAGFTTLGFVSPISGSVVSAQSPAAVRILGTPAPLEVGIDIRPDSQQNMVNPMSNGVITVAILSQVNFDAPNDVDRNSLTFGRTGNEKSLASCSKEPLDVNQDGLQDLVCHFYTRLAGFRAGDVTGVLKGLTVSGVPFIGMDSIRIVPQS